MFYMSALELISEVQKKFRDANSAIRSKAQVLEAADEVLQEMFTTARMAGSDHLLQNFTIAPADMTEVEDDIWEYELPEWVAAVRRIEGLSPGSTSKPFSLEQIELEGRARLGSLLNTPAWYRAKQDRVFHIGGVATSFTEFRIWYHRRWPPLHYGTAQAGSTTTLQFDDSSGAVGKVIERDDLYIDTRLVITNALPTASLKDSIRTISDYAGSTRTATVSAAFSAAVDSTTQYAMIVPVAPEHTSLLVNQTAYTLFEDVGQDSELVIKAPRLEKLWERYRSSLRSRDHARPKKLYSSRA